MIIVSPIIRLALKIASFALYLLTAFCCFGGNVSPELFPLGSVAVVGMPVMLTLSAVVCGVWLCMGRWFVGGAGVLMFLVCLSPIRMWFPMHTASKSVEGEPVLTILTWNILGGEDLEMPATTEARTLNKILEVNADVVCLQEVFDFSEKGFKHFSQSAMDSLRKIYPYELGKETYDLRILSKYPLRNAYSGSRKSLNWGVNFIVSSPMGEIAMANVHFPSFGLDEDERSIFTDHNVSAREKENQGKDVLRKMKRAFPIRAEVAEDLIDCYEGVDMPAIVCGDFNDVPASWVYRMFLNAGFKDAYCATNFFPTYTFYPNLFYFHLDQIFYRGALRPLSVERIDLKTSDHLGLVARFQILK